MFHVALWEPEIPPNTGNIARLCAATGATLHLIGRLGFRIDDRSLRRAGLDYWSEVTVLQHAAFTDFEQGRPYERLFCFSARGTRPYTHVHFQPGDALLFGPETRGLPAEILDRYSEQTFVIPMSTGKVRSLNLSTAVGVVLYEALRQTSDW